VNDTDMIFYFVGINMKYTLQMYLIRILNACCCRCSYWTLSQ